MYDILLHPSDHKNKNDWRNILSFLDKNLDYSSLGSALDLGAGMSNIGNHILKNNPASRIVSIDINEDNLAASRARDNSIVALKHDINKPLPFTDKSFDLVSCVGTLHYRYITSPKEVIREMARVSQRYVMLDFFSKNSLYSFLLRLRHPGYSPRMYSKKDAEDLISPSAHLKTIYLKGGRTPFPNLFPYSGKEVFYLLEKKAQ